MRALKLEPIEHTSCEACWYPDTVKWAEAAFDAGFDGCVWMSWASNSARAYVFFDRRDSFVEASPDVPVRAYLNGPELDWLIDFCAIINIDVEV